MTDPTEFLKTDLPNADAYLSATKALIAALDGDALRAMDATEKRWVYRRLILQDTLPEALPILANEAASLISGGNKAMAGRLAEELSPTLREIIDASADAAPGYKNAVVLLLVLRAHLGGALDERRIRELHLDWFERFGPEDLKLPYSTMFCADSYSTNRDEVLATYPPHDPRVLADPGLSLRHLALLELLSGRAYFRANDNSDLDLVLGRCLILEGADERAHARTLVLRHWRPGGQLSAARLADLDLGEVEAQARRLSATRARLAETAASPPSRVSARWLQKRTWQAVQASRALAARRAPFVGAQHRLRIAVCVSGQLRGYKQALASWRSTLFAAAEPSFFVHSWTGIGRADAQPFRHVLPFEGSHFIASYRKEIGLIGYEAAQARYPALFRQLKIGAKADLADLCRTYGTDHVVLQADDDTEFASLSNQQKMHYKIYSADRMARAAGDFDIFVRLRPDLEVRLIAFDWRDLHAAAHARPVLYAERPPGLHYGNLMVGDQFAIASPEIMAVYAETWESFPPIAELGASAWPEALTGHVSLAVTCWSSGVAMEKAPVRFGALLETAPMRTAEIRTALEEDLATRQPDRIDTAMLDAVRKDAAD